ncbi:MAG: hypothetical protein WCQ90_04645 [Deltaproteobacteria bacterium]
MRGKRGIIMMVLGWLVFTGLAIDGYSQEKPYIPEKSVLQEPSDMQRPYKYSSRQRLGLIVIPDLTVDKATYTGPCPAVFTFKAYIYANRATDLYYKLVVSSDPFTMEPAALTLKKDERKEVIHTLELGDPAGPPEFNKQVHIEVLHVPTTKFRSNKILLKGKCTDHTEIKHLDLTSQQGEQKRQPGPSALSVTPSTQEGLISGNMTTPQPDGRERVPVEPVILPKGGEVSVPGNLPTSQSDHKELPSTGQ